MNGLQIVITFIVAYLAVYFAAGFDGVRAVAGVRCDLLPPLMVYSGLTSGLAWTAGLAVFGGLLFDTVSANPLGLSIVPLGASGFMVHWHREWILRDQPYAQFVLGTLASMLSPLLSVAILLAAGHDPMVGWPTVWQIAVMGFFGGGMTPVLFWGLGRMQTLLAYSRVPEARFRDDREIKRGRY
jgi:cell shape-determining protein MreD